MADVKTTHKRVDFVSGRCESAALPYAMTHYGWRRIGAMAPPYVFSNYVPGLAHDTLDHWDMQSFEDEAMAHGCEQWMRGGNFSVRLPAVFHVSHPYWWAHREDYLILRANMGSMLKYKCPPLKRRSPEPHLDVITECRLRQAFSRHTKKPYNYLDWFRHGYRQAEERYSVMGRDRACELFQQLVDFFHDNVVKGIRPNRRLSIIINDDGGWSHTERSDDDDT